VCLNLEVSNQKTNPKGERPFYRNRSFKAYTF